MSHYANYIKERLNKQIYEDENGFATYFEENDYIYIEDIYVIPEKRKEGIASYYADHIAKIAEANGYKKLLGSVVPSANGSTESIKVLISYGFKLASSHDNIIYFIKEI